MNKVEYDLRQWPDEVIDVEIEAVKTFEGENDAFITDLRVKTGTQKGALKSVRWFRRKRDGQPRKDTANLLELFGLEIDAPAWKLTNKSFQTKPWYPTGNQYPVFTKIKKLDSNGAKFDDIPF